MNLEVDVMEGDEFVVGERGAVFQVRNDTYRMVSFGWVGSWINLKWLIETPRLDLPTFTRYCEGCGLTVKMVKPEPVIETIKPPEWGAEFPDGEVRLFRSEKAAQNCGSSWKPVRIDWGRA